ncbi:MAG: hypothetical protein GEU98_13500 [Pseudonocardiaceae bacterium]|nr:hypothetical protein [Pseudonocardiaceae bacterium]
MLIKSITLPLRLGFTALGTMRGTIQATTTFAREMSQAMLALPRIARALEQLAPTTGVVRQLNELRGTIQRLEQLGNFVAEELPEAVFQLEGLRSQLTAIDRRLVAISAEFAALDRAVQAAHAALDTAGHNGSPVAAATRTNGSGKQSTKQSTKQSAKQSTKKPSKQSSKPSGKKSSKH